tara:strand:- start:105 stop:1613 length:1509 start_codon:yes stop_codon:yes gene_type:complete
MQKSLKGWVVILFTIAFNFFFWKEKFGLNIVLFTGVFGTILYLFHPDEQKKLPTKIAIAGIVLSSIAILWHNSLFSKFMLFGSIFLYIASLVEKEIKTIYYLIPSGFLGIITSPFRKNSFYTGPKNAPTGNTLKWIKLSVIPFAILVLFTIIYSVANPVFANKLNELIDNLGDYFSDIFKYYPFTRFLFIGLGLLIGVGIYYFKSIGLFDEREKNHKIDLVRKKTTAARIFPMLALKAELNGAIITILMLNVLLLFLNMLDFNVFVIQDSTSITDNFASNLHRGTSMLIFSIFLSAAIVLYIFRGNINFYKKNKFLKTITYIWIVQNMILSLYVVVRVYHYILHHGLAYKRIGVVIFVIATIIGLITLIKKVKNTKTVSYLFRINGISIYAILVISALFNWDGIIASHNFEHAETKNIDYIFELSMSDKVLPILDQNRDRLALNNNKYKNSNYSFSWTKSQTLLEKLDQRIVDFKLKEAKRSWLSWNYSDSETASYFGEVKK